MNFNWQQADWPNFRYNATTLQTSLTHYSESMGAMRYLLSMFDSNFIEDKAITQLTNEAIDTSAIEGISLNRDAVLSSVCRQLGRKDPHPNVNNATAEGFASLIIDVRDTYASKLSKHMLLHWHALLLKESTARVLPGKFRTHKESMMVLAGGIEGSDIRFIAPPSKHVEHEMTQFVKWFNSSLADVNTGMMHPAVRISIAHLYFESIHPFEDGNGRIGRMLVCKAMAQHVGQPVLLPISVIIRKAKTEYYEAIQAASLTNNVTDWCLFFTRILTSAMDQLSQELVFLVKKIQFFNEHSPHLNARQSKVMERMAAERHAGFTGGMNASKYQKIAKISKATATRDLTHLCKIGALIKIGSGPGIRYHLPFAVPLIE